MRPRDRPMPPLPAMPTGVITEDERRARQRLHVQRSYHKKKVSGSVFEALGVTRSRDVSTRWNRM